MIPHTREPIIFEHRPRFRVTKTAIRFNGHSLAASDVASIVEDDASIDPRRAGALGAVAVAGLLAAVWAGQLLVIPFLLLLLVGTVIWVRTRGCTLTLVTHSGQELTLTTSDRELAAGLARGVRLAIAFQAPAG